MKRRAFLKEGAVLAAGLASSPLVFSRSEEATFLNTHGGVLLIFRSPEKRFF